MDSRKYEQQIEQLQVELLGTEGLLNEIITLANLFIPLLQQLPQTDKKMLSELTKRMQIANMKLSMKRNAPPTIVQKSW